tara:strand:- start:12 stop:152 length:141 start_codon:yes stop_codon:yes gene_type:complete
MTGFTSSAFTKSRGVKFGIKRKYDKDQIAEIMKKREIGDEMKWVRG